MLTNPAIAIVVIVCLTLLILATLGCVTWLALTGHDATALAALVFGPLVTFAGHLARRMIGRPNQTASGGSSDGHNDAQTSQTPGPARP
jgi:hypothetical protein